MRRLAWSCLLLAACADPGVPNPARLWLAPAYGEPGFSLVPSEPRPF
jgi:hypothetical protein